MENIEMNNYEANNDVMENIEMNNDTTELETKFDPSADVEIVSEKSHSFSAAGVAVAYGIGVATPFIIGGIVKLVKWGYNKIKSKLEEKAQACDDDFSDNDKVA